VKRDAQNSGTDTAEMAHLSPSMWASSLSVKIKQNINDNYFGSSNVGLVLGSFLPTPAGFAVLSSSDNNSSDISTLPWNRGRFSD
jgi:hypothetical protein